MSGDAGPVGLEHVEEPETYAGPLALRRAGGTDDGVVVTVHLAGFFQPIDGSFRWHGRTRSDPGVDALAAEVARGPIEVRVPGGPWRTGRLGETNPWGGHRLAGSGPPPFAVAEEPVEAVGLPGQG